MNIPRPPGWTTKPWVLRLRRHWHRLHLPCPICFLEGRGWRR